MTLKPSERVTLIKEVAKRLDEEESYSFIDVSLKAFGLPIWDTWNGDKLSYVLKSVEQASDESLLGLAEHVGIKFDTKPPRLDPPFWREGMLRLFISHLAVHRAFAGELQKALEGFGVSSFVAHNDIEPTLEWQNEIETALATCNAAIALLHPDFHRSNWTDQEIGFAMGRGVPVYAVKFGQDPYGFIGRFQAFNGDKKTPDQIANEIFEAFVKNKQTAHILSDALVKLFVESGSWAKSKSHMGYLEQITAWNKSYPARLRSAVKHNEEISQSFGVPARVENLIKKWESA
jgi:hypothetical protein